MKPVFALSLSFEGITLLARAAGGWRRVGRVSPESETLSQDMAKLKAEATALDIGPVRCKVVIPDDQIRYMTLETGAQSYFDRRAAARKALEGATPYAVDELAFDICEDGAKTHVAAVARETLVEAEDFVADHGLEPMCFVASPGDAGFLGEPYFADSRHAASVLNKGDEVETDGIAVIDLGPLEKGASPAPSPKAAPEQPEPSATDGKPAAKTPEPDTTEAPVQGFVSRRSSDPTQSLVRAIEDAKAGKPRVPAPRKDASERVKFPKELGGAEPQPPRRKPGEKPALEALAARRGPDAEAGAVPPTPPPDAPVPNRDVLAREMARRGAELTAQAAKAIASRKQQAAEAEPDPRAQEAERLTVFGARSTDKTPEVGGKPRFLGLILTALLLLFILGIAVWSALFTEDGLGRYLSGDSELIVVSPDPAPVLAPVTQPEAIGTPQREQTVSAPEADPAPPAPEPEQEEAAPIVTAPETAPQDSAPEPSPPQVIADPAPEQDAPALSRTDTAVLDALRAPAPTRPLSEEEAQARYAVTGIWPRAPQEPNTPAVIDLDDMYIASIDPATTMQDALALPDPNVPGHDRPLSGEALASEPVTPPAPPVEPTPEGTLSPDGFRVFLGRPPVVPPPTPDRAEAAPPAETEAPEETNAPAETAPADTDSQAQEATQPDIPRVRPRVRPEGIVEESERTQLGGRTRIELASLRPRLRPEGVTETARAAETEEEDETAAAIIASLAPRARPGNIAAIIEESNPTPASLGSTAGALVAPPRTSTPSIPTTASVARQATVENAINLRQVNLIGVYGTSANRRALVRLPTGRYRKVKVGDRIDGGQVVAIGDSELRYQKGGRNLTLKIPSG